jgi:hypothetical protein
MGAYTVVMGAMQVCDGVWNWILCHKPLICFIEQSVVVEHLWVWTTGEKKMIILTV